MAQATGCEVAWSAASFNYGRPKRPRTSSDSVSEVSPPGSIPSGPPRLTHSKRTPDVDNIGGAAFVCCSRIDGLIYARLLRSELAFAPDRACAIGGGEESVKFVKESEVFCVLLTKQLLTDSFALFEIWTAVQHRVPLVPCVIVGAGYAFSEKQLPRLPTCNRLWRRAGALHSCAACFLLPSTSP
eukprot:3850174-Prymnesium_polylepis.1